MGRDGKARRDKRYGRLSRSGHTTHQPRGPEQDPPTRPYETPPARTYDAPRPRPPYRPTESQPRYDPPRHDPPRHDPPRYDPPRHDPPSRRPAHDDDATRDFGRVRAEQPTHEFGRVPGPRDADQPPTAPSAPTPPYGPPTTAGGAAKVIGRAALTNTNRAARAVTQRVISASESGGAKQSGLTALIWNQVLSYGADAMVTVALAGTVFFGASAHAQRGNVLLYLLITMAPFAVIAPVIGPALDRLQHGRRWTMAATGIGRAVLALVMAAHATDLLVLYPCALGSLVLSKAYGVLRAAAAPRLVPPTMTLTEANARLTIFGLGSTVVLGGVVGAVIKATGSYGAGLVLTGVAFGACAFFAVRLPKTVDSSQPAPRHPEEPARSRTQPRVPPMTRLVGWARRGFDPWVVIAMQGESALRLLSGMLTIYLAFYVESTAHGLTGALELSMVVGAAGVGNFLGTAIGTRIAMPKPALIVVVSTVGAGVVCFLVAVMFSPVIGAVGFLIGYVGNALCKIALDSLIQRDVVETLRSSAFGRSETFLQLAWVIGAAIGVVLPSSDGDGPIGFCVVGAIVLAVGALIALRYRAAGHATAHAGGHPAPMTGATGHPDARGWAEPGGSVQPRSID